MTAYFARGIMPEHEDIFDQLALINHKEEMIYVELKKWNRPSKVDESDP